MNSRAKLCRSLCPALSRGERLACRIRAKCGEYQRRERAEVWNKEGGEK